MKKPLVALAAFGLAATFVSASQPAQAAVRAGVLNCHIAPGVGYVVASQKTLDCVYTPSASGRQERYSGRITRVGLDVGFTGGGNLAWAVYAASEHGSGALAGAYGGASAEATVGAGVGANVLLGGWDRSVALQPISVGTQSGLDLALAVSGLQLDYAAAPVRRHRHRR